jgi:hypothetical protein|tara:strand:- start:1169 stop:1906 length:738 start_codon:yes stop_codon:yes gene_type:complete
MSEDFNSILDEVKKLKKDLTFYSPTKDEEFAISPLNLHQQKLIIENSISSNLSILFFNTVLFDIIKNNFSGDLSSLDTLDRVSIALSLRSKISNDYEEDDVKVKISDIIKNMNEKIIIDGEDIKTESFNFKVEKPNLILDNKINKIILKKYESKKFDEEKVNSLISDIYVYEILKFVKQISFNDITIDTEENFQNSLKILSEIDSSELKAVFKFINKVRDNELKLASIPNSDKNISITPDFFIVQ